MASDFLMSQNYGDSHMGCPIGFTYRHATLPWMGTIGERIRQLRKAKGLTQPVLAKAISIDQSTLSDIERGAGFSAEILMRLAEELGASCEYIMRGHVQQSVGLRRAQQAVKELTDEERIALLAAIMQPPAHDNKVAKHLPPAPATPEEERIANRLAQKVLSGTNTAGVSRKRSGGKP